MGFDFYSQVMFYTGFSEKTITEKIHIYADDEIDQGNQAGNIWIQQQAYSKNKSSSDVHLLT